MSLRPKFKIFVESDSSSIIFEDITGAYSETNPNGYGGPNIAMSNILQTKLNVVFPNGGEYLLFSNFLPGMGKWKIPAGLFSDLNKTSSRHYTSDCDCGCNPTQPIIGMYPILFPYDFEYYVNYDCERPNTLAKYMDGCYEFRYEVYAQNGVGQLLCDYFVKTVICEGQRLEVNQNGGWVDVTGSSTNDHGNITYSLTQSPLKITAWRVMEGASYIKGDIVVGSGCTISTEVDDYEENQLAGSSSKVVKFFSVIAKRLSEKAFDVTVGSCNIQDTVQGKAIDVFSLAHARYNSIVGDINCGCDCVNTEVQAINLLLDSIN